MNIATITAAVASLSWLIVIGVIVIVIIRASRGQRLRSGTALIIGTVAIALVLNVLSAGIVFVLPQERGVVISAVPGQEGIRANALQPGLNWIIPFFENVVMYPISRQTYTMSGVAQEGQIQGDDSVQARTSDGQVVFVDASVIFTIDPNRTIDVHIRWQNNYVDNLIRPQARGVIRDWVSQFGVEGVYSTNREELTANINEALREELGKEGLFLVDFVMRNITFSPEYAASVEQKQIAEQLAQQAQLTVEQRRQEAEQARQLAQGQADAVEIRAAGDAAALLINAQAEADARLLRAQAEAQALELLAAAIEDNPDVLTLEYVQRLAPNIPLLLPVPGFDQPDTQSTLPPSAPTPETTP